jgi:peptide/nickel transport system ATP-binding protein
LAEPACDADLPELVPAGRHDGRAACRRLGITPASTIGGGENWSSQEPGRRPAVLLHDVRKDFVIRQGFRAKERLHALRGVDLEVGEGESVALVGESGCGKSTLLRAVAGLLAPSGGSIELGPGARPQMVFQDAGASLTPWLTVGELVGERLRSEGVGRAQRKVRVADALALVGLPEEVAEAKAAQLSGGQRQRVALARATIVPPEVLLCDEPTSALDVSLAATVLNLLGRIRRELGMAMLFVTHDLGAARVVADRIAVMYLGRIVEVGPADEITRDPTHPYTRALLSAVPGRGVARAILEGESASPIHPPSGCAFHPRCPVALETCASDDPPVVGVGHRRVACVRAHEDIVDLSPAVDEVSGGRR